MTDDKGALARVDALMIDVEKGMTTSRTRTPKRRPESAATSDGLDVVENQQHAPAEIDQELYIPLTSRAVFWQPRHLALSDALLHVPYLFWLVETCRPASVVQFGTGDGVAFLALCQAIDKLSLPTPCLGINTDADTPSLPEAMAAQHQTHYDDFSAIVREDPASAVRHVHGRSIDLLVLNTPLTDECVMALRAQWQSRLSDQAVVVVINADRNVQTTAAREFIDALGQACPHILLAQGGGMIDTYLVGQAQPDRLKKLAALDTGSVGYMAARQVFSRLGQGVFHGEVARTTHADTEKVQAALSDLGEQLKQRENELRVQQRQAEMARQAEAAQVSLSNDLQARLFDAEGTVESLRTALDEALEKHDALSAQTTQQTDTLRTKAEALEAQNAKLTADLRTEAELRTKAEALEPQNAKLTAALDERMADIVALSEGFEKRLGDLAERNKKLESEIENRLGDIAALTRDYEKRLEESLAAQRKLEQKLAEANEKRREFFEAKRELQEQQIKMLTERDTALARQAERLEKEVAAREQMQETVARQTHEIQILTAKLEENERLRQSLLDERAALLNSTSWRVTSPMRKAKLLISR